jgi:hypothetical protein
MKLVMTLLVRDEEDILEANLDFHLAHGVDFFIVTDNLSVDGTRDIVQSYVRRGLAVCLNEPSDDYSQYRWVTKMARMAARSYGADWVINSDADEFWVGAGRHQDIKQCLLPIAPDWTCLTVPRCNFIPVGGAGAGFFAKRMTLRETVSLNTEGQPLPPKVCHRGYTDVDIDQGNHGAGRSGVALVGTLGPLKILHYPIRSYRQFENKIIKGGAAYARNTELPPHIGATWRNLYQTWQQGGLPARYRQMLPSAASVRQRIASGELVYDDTVVRTLRANERTRLAASA